MSTPLHFQHTINARPERVFDALTQREALETWFAEHADVALEEGRYDFWGCHTPETPSRERGRHAIILFEPNRRLQYVWQLRGSDTTVDFRLTQKDSKTIVGLWHENIPSVPQGQPGCYSLGDIWWLWLENLRRYTEGRSVVRSDFSVDMRGDLVKSIDIDGSPEDVWRALTDPDLRNQWIAAGVTDDIAVGEDWIDWGDEHGGLKVLEIHPGQSFSMAWEIENTPTVVTWTVEGTGSRTRLTLAHSGFAPDRQSDGEWGGWITYLSMIKSVVEYGREWLPPIQEIASGAAAYYAVSVWERQEELMENEDAAWTAAR